MLSSIQSIGGGFKIKMLSNIGFEPQKYQGIFICMLKIKFCRNHDSSIKLQFDICKKTKKGNGSQS